MGVYGVAEAMVGASGGRVETGGGEEFVVAVALAD